MVFIYKYHPYTDTVVPNSRSKREKARYGETQLQTYLKSVLVENASGQFYYD